MPKQTVLISLKLGLELLNAVKTIISSHGTCDCDQDWCDTCPTQNLIKRTEEELFGED